MLNRRTGTRCYFPTASSLTTRGQTPNLLDAPSVGSVTTSSTSLPFLTNPESVTVSLGSNFIVKLFVDFTIPICPC